MQFSLQDFSIFKNKIKKEFSLILFLKLYFTLFDFKIKIINSNLLGNILGVSSDCPFCCHNVSQINPFYFFLKLNK